MKKIAQINILILFAVSLLTFNLRAQDSKYDSLITSGIKQIYSIKFPEAERSFKRIIKDYPNKPAGKFFLAMIDWWKIMLDPENESFDEGFQDKIEAVIDQCENILDRDPNNVDALFFKGGAIGFRGRLRAYRESWLKAADDGREALPLVQKAGRLDPKNVDVKLGFGIYNYYAAVLPEKYSMLKAIMLFLPSGNKQRGIADLEYVSRDGIYAKYEARYFLMSINYYYEENYLRALQYAEMLNKDFPDNPAFERWLGRIFARQGNSEKSSEIFNNIFQKGNKELPGYTTQFVKREAVYYVGYNLQQTGKLDSAKTYFLQCADISNSIENKRDSGFLINSYLYLGMINDNSGNRAKAIEYYKKVLDMRDFGRSKELAEQYLKIPYKR